MDSFILLLISFLIRYLFIYYQTKKKFNIYFIFLSIGLNKNYLTLNKNYYLLNIINDKIYSYRFLYPDHFDRPNFNNKVIVRICILLSNWGLADKLIFWKFSDSYV